MNQPEAPQLLFGSAFKHLQQPLQLESKPCVVPVEISQFANQETRIHIQEPLRPGEVMILSSVLTNNNLMELALLADAAKRLGATSVTAVSPWLGYTPQDKVFRPGEPLSSQVAIKMLESAGIDHFVCMDLHSSRLEEMFTVKITNVTALEVFVRTWRQLIQDPSQWVVVALDKGGIARNQQLAEALGVAFIMFEKKRDRETGSITMIAHDVDLTDKKVISFDDFTSTGGTLVKAAELIHEAGANEFHCLVTHIVTPHVIEKIQDGHVSSLTTTNSTFLSEMAQGNEKIRVLDIWNYLLTLLLKGESES